MRYFLFCFIVLIGVAFNHTIAKAEPSMVLMGDRTALFEKRTYVSDTGKATFDYYLLKPENYDPRQSYPLVLNLHGASGHSWGAYTLADPAMRKAYPAFVLVPYATSIPGWQVPAYDDKFPEPIVHIANIIGKLETEFSIDKKRIYITGYSMGGYGTFGMVAMYPDMFAAAAPLCGGGNVKDAPLMVRTPMLVAHGALDPNIPVEQSRKMVAAIHDAGGDINYTEYPKVGHGVWNEVYANPKFWQWMFSQKKP